MKYGYQSEKLSQARSSLMLPHPQGEAMSIAECFDFCSRAFHQLDTAGLDEDATKWVKTIEGLMNTSGIEAKDGRWLIKAESLTDDEKYELSNAVEQLAYWFHEYHRDR